MDAEKPKWMSDHEAADYQSFELLNASLKRIEAKLNPDHPDYINRELEQKLDPIYENYEAATRLGKWLMAVAVFGSVLLGIVLSVKQLFGK